MKKASSKSRTVAPARRPKAAPVKASIIWLASYPKSGNTWTRIFLANYLTNPENPVPINEVHRYGMGDSIAKTYRMVAGKDRALQNLDDVNVTLRLREKVLRGIVANGADVNLVKTHNIRKDAFGWPLIPAKFTRSAVYIIRNPLDMVLSYARHYGMNAADTIDAISRSDNANATDEATVWQFLGSWSEHVQSWTSKAPYPQVVLRYEDMLERPEETFAKLVKHVGLPLDQSRLKKAIRFASFDEVSKQEKSGGFKENPGKSKTFFTSGTSGGWEDALSTELADRLRADHRDVMKRYGYLE